METIHYQIRSEGPPREKLITFKIPKQTDKRVFLDNIEFPVEFQNIDYTNNYILWLRRVVRTLNYSPYFNEYSNALPPDEWHLCQLFIDPGLYKTPTELVAELNKRLKESFTELLGVGTTDHIGTSCNKYAFREFPTSGLSLYCVYTRGIVLSNLSNTSIYYHYQDIDGAWQTTEITASGVYDVGSSVIGTLSIINPSVSGGFDMYSVTTTFMGMEFVSYKASSIEFNWLHNGASLVSSFFLDGRGYGSFTEVIGLEDSRVQEFDDYAYESVDGDAISYKLVLNIKSTDQMMDDHYLHLITGGTISVFRASEATNIPHIAYSGTILSANVPKTYIYMFDYPSDWWDSQMTFEGTANFRIAYSPGLDKPRLGIYGINLYNDSVTPAADGAILNDPTFFSAKHSENVNHYSYRFVTENSDVPIIYTSQALLSARGKAYVNELIGFPENIPDVILDNIDQASAQEKIITVPDMNSDSMLSADPFMDGIFVSLLSGDDLLTYDEGMLTSISNIIPVAYTHDVPASVTSLDKILSTDFHSDSRTVKLPNIMRYRDGDYVFNDSIIDQDEYRRIVATIDDYYYEFGKNKYNILSKLGFNTLLVNSNQSNAQNYIIKGKYYSETLYNGPLIMQYTANISDTSIPSPIPAGTDIRTLEEYIPHFYKRVFKRYFAMSIYVPEDVVAIVTSNPNYELELNKSFSVNGGIHIAARDINTAGDKVMISINKLIVPVDDTYIVLTSSDTIYPFKPCNGTLTISVIK